MESFPDTNSLFIPSDKRHKPNLRVQRPQIVQDPQGKVLSLISRSVRGVYGLH